MLPAFLVATIFAGVPAQEAPTRAAPAFELLRAGSGVSQVLSQPLDVTFASEMTGNWFSLRGDGSTAGPLALSAVGSPTSQSDRVCPNGPDCGSVTSRRINGSSTYWESTALDESGHSLSGCAAFVLDATSSNATLMGLANLDVLFQTTASARIALTMTASQTFTASSLVQAGAVHFACFTYDSGTGTGTVVLDGSTTSSSAMTAVPPSSSKWRIGLRGNNSEPFVGRILAAFKTDKALSASTIAAMTTAVLPSLQGSRGETVTTTRSTVRSCCNSAGCALIQANRACVRGGALDDAPTHTNLVPQSEAVETASWAKGGASISANAELSPFGTLTADKLVEDSTNGAHYVADAFSTTSGSTYAYSVYLKAGERTVASVYSNSAGGNPNIRVDLTTGAVLNAINAVSGSVKVDEASRGYYRISFAAVAATTGSAYLYVSPYFNAGTYQGDGSSGLYVWGAQVEAGSVATPYCPTTTATAVCNADSVSAAASGLPSTSGTVSLDWTPAFATQPATQVLYDSSGGGAEGHRLSVDTLGRINWTAYHSSVSGPILTPCCTVTWTAGQRYHLRVEWDATGLATVYRDEAQVLIGTTGQVATSAASSVALSGSGLISDLCAGAAGRCR